MYHWAEKANNAPSASRRSSCLTAGIKRIGQVTRLSNNMRTSEKMEARSAAEICLDERLVSLLWL
jgi:hypothetical protein